MKKRFKRKNPAEIPQLEPDVSDLVNKILGQVVNLEKKIDVLINRASEKPSEERHFPKPFNHFDRPYRNDRERQDNAQRERKFTQAICADCNKECEVPFKPSGDRPVYCKECFLKRKEEGLFKNRHNNPNRERSFIEEHHFNKQQDSAFQKPGKKKRLSHNRKKGRN